MSDKHWFLKRCDLFEHLTPEQIKRVESRCRMRKFARNEPIYLPGDASSGVLLIGAGRAKICGFTPDGKQSILAFIEPGEVFGELAILDDGRREEYAEAVQNTTILLIPADEIQQLMREHATLSLSVTKLIGLRRRRIERRLKYLLFRSNRDRLTHLLLELVEQYGIPTDEGIDLGIRLSHQDLANVIGSTRETVTMHLGEMQTAGLIRIGRQKIVILSLERLAKAVEVDAPALKAGGSTSPPQPSLFT